MDPGSAFMFGLFLGSTVTAFVVGGLPRTEQHEPSDTREGAQVHHELDGDPDTQLGIHPN